MEINNNMLGKYVNIADNIGSLVNYKDDRIDQVLRKFFCVKRKTNDIMGKVFNQLGYKFYDTINMTNIIYNDDDIIIKYEVNGKYDINNQIIIKFSDLIFQYKMVFCDKDKDIVLNVTVFNRKDIELRVSKIIEKLDNCNIYSREYNRYYAKYGIVVNNKLIELYLGIKYYEDDYRDRYMLILDNEIELENYLKNIDLSLGIEDIYNDISNYIGDSSKYVDIKLGIKSLDKNLVTDKIIVKNGKCINFMITNGNRCISVDEFGNCVSKYSDDLVDIVTNVNSDNASYTISAKNVSLLREQAFVHGIDEYESGMGYIALVKKRVMKLGNR